ncbi:hypothetical protein ABEB36_014953 [Hypothenemus hampei]|uniref:Tetratricopeptide repeat protein 17 n=1 Tax=Hypothenemus hampei TaxID=57062 RepID=A0ABD1E606_HYPHA
MKYPEAIPKIPVNFLVLFYVIGFKASTTNSRTSTLWKLSSDRTKIIEGDPNDFSERTFNLIESNSISQFTSREDPLFHIIMNTQRYGSAWMKHTEEQFCGNQAKTSTILHTKKNDTQINIRQEKENQMLEEHELSCGKPVNFTFYDNLVGVMDRAKHPHIVESQAMIEFVKKYKLKIGSSFDISMIEKKLKQTKKDKPKSIGTLQQLGNFWRIKGDPRRAIECFRKALAISPHNSEVLLNLAKVLLHLQYLDDAMYLTRRSLEVGPPERGAWQQYFTLGEIFKAYGHYQEAQVHFRHTLDLQPGYEPAIKLMKELEQMPLSPWQTYTYIIIGSLVIVVLLFLNNLDRNSESGYNRSHKHFSKSLKSINWNNRKSKKSNNT